MKKSNKYIIAIICKILMILSNFGVTIFINRGLGVEGKGQYAYIINIVEILYLVFSLGIGQAYATFKKQGIDRIREISVALSFIHGLTVILLGGLLVTVFKIDYGYSIVILTSLAIVKVIVSMIAVIENSIKRNIIQTIINTMYLFVLIIFYCLKLISLKTVLVIYALNEIIRILTILITFKMKADFKSINKKYLKLIYSKGFITMVVMILITINYSIDIVMLKKLSTLSELGLYSVGVTFSNMLLIIPDAFKEVLFGEATKKDFKKREVYYSIFFSIIIYFISLIGFILLGKFVINLLYGKEFINSYKLSLVLFIGTLFMIFFKILQPVYIANGNQWKVAIFLSLSAIMNIIINFILIPECGNYGAAIASVISYTICGLLFLSDFIFNKKWKTGDENAKN